MQYFQGSGGQNLAQGKKSHSAGRQVLQLLWFLYVGLIGSSRNHPVNHAMRPPLIDVWVDGKGIGVGRREEGCRGRGNE